MHRPGAERRAGRRADGLKAGFGFRSGSWRSAPSLRRFNASRRSRVSLRPERVRSVARPRPSRYRLAMNETLFNRTFGALLFDMDGTIISSVAAAERVWTRLG